MQQVFFFPNVGVQFSNQSARVNQPQCAHVNKGLFIEAIEVQLPATVPDLPNE